VTVDAETQSSLLPTQSDTQSPTQSSVGDSVGDPVADSVGDQSPTSRRPVADSAFVRATKKIKYRAINTYVR